MKKIALTLLLYVSGSLPLIAQTNFYKFSIGGGAGLAAAFADLDNKTFSFAGYGTLDYHLTEYTTIGIEFQKGELAGGDISFDSNHRQFINSYLTGTGNVKVAVGEMLNNYQLNDPFLYNIRGLYAGLGFGLIKNKISNVRYYGDDYFMGTDSSIEGIIPINVGINFYFPNQWGHTRFAVNLNLQQNIVLGEGLDGYDSAFALHNDMYTYASAGIKYHFGPFGLDRRR